MLIEFGGRGGLAASGQRVQGDVQVTGNPRVDVAGLGENLTDQCACFLLGKFVDGIGAEVAGYCTWRPCDK